MYWRWASKSRLVDWEVLDHSFPNDTTHDQKHGSSEIFPFLRFRNCLDFFPWFPRVCVSESSSVESTDTLEIFSYVKFCNLKNGKKSEVFDFSTFWQYKYRQYFIWLNFCLTFFSAYFDDNIFCHFVASMISGLVTTTASMPVDIAKTRWK